MLFISAVVDKTLFLCARHFFDTWEEITELVEKLEEIGVNCSERRFDK